MKESQDPKAKSLNNNPMNTCAYQRQQIK